MTQCQKTVLVKFCREETECKLLLLEIPARHEASYIEHSMKRVDLRDRLEDEGFLHHSRGKCRDSSRRQFEGI